MKLVGSMILLFVALFHRTEAFAPIPKVRHTRPTLTDLQAPKVLAAYKNSKTTTSSPNNKTLSKVPLAKKEKNAVKGDDDEKEGVFSKPANLIFLPFVAIFGLDLVLNILVVVKRTIEVALTGQYTCTGPWC